MDRHHQPSGGLGLNIFDYFPNRRPGGSGASRDAVNLPKIVRSTMDTGREVNVIEAKQTRSQPKKVISMISGPTVRANCYSPAFSTEESYATAPSSPLPQQQKKSRMQFNFNVTPSKGATSANNSKPSTTTTTYTCDVNGSRLVNNNNNNYKIGSSAAASTAECSTYGIKGKCVCQSARECVPKTTEESTLRK